MVFAKKTALGKWRQRNGFLNHYLLLLTNVVGYYQNGTKCARILDEPILWLTYRVSHNISTMCDFHNFGFIFAGQCMQCLPQRLKSTFFEIFSNGAAPKGPAE